MKIFFYGNFQDPSKPMHQVAARGQLRMIRDTDDPAAIFDHSAQSLVFGQLREVSMDRLASLNALEAPEFSLQKIRLIDGRWYYAYEYASQDFENLELIPSGKFTPTPKSETMSEEDDQDFFGLGKIDRTYKTGGIR